MFYIRGATIFQNSRAHLMILGARRVMRSKFHTEEPQTLGAKVKNLVTTATWRPELRCTPVLYVFYNLRRRDLCCFVQISLIDKETNFI
jgi:hypothetical protein